jgi:uncharacterized membrane protein YfcA
VLEYWFLLPVGFAIAVLVMSAGVSGATLWVPVYLLWLGLDVALAFWLGLLTMLFGFGSGVYRNWRDGTYDGALVRGYALATVPAALAGGWLSGMVDQRIIVGVFGIFLFVYAIAIAARTLGNNEVPLRRETVSWPAAMVGGALTGFISIGVGILAMPAVLRHRSSTTPATGVGSLVMIIFLTSIAATVGRMRPPLLHTISAQFPELIRIAIWALPAVVIGGQVGPRLARKLPSERHARLYFSAVLIVVAVLTLLRARA